MAIVSDVEIRLRADIARLRQDMERARQEVNRPLAQMSQAVQQFKGLLAGMGAGLGISALVGQLVGAQREFDKMNASLIAVTGSSKAAKEVFGVLQSFAAKTPYSLDQVTEAFLKLRNMGLAPSERALTSYGNTASALNKPLMQLVEAVADAATGQFERLTELGIKSQQQGDKIAFTFQGTTTQIGNSAAEIEKYLMQIGEVNFAGAMALQADTLNGDLSALADTWSQTLTAFSQSGFGEGARDGAKALTGALIDLQAIIKASTREFDEHGKAVEQITPLHSALTEVFTVAGVVARSVSGGIENLTGNLKAYWAVLSAAMEGRHREISGIIGDRMRQSEVESAITRADIERIRTAADAGRKARAEESKQTKDRLEGQKIESKAVAGLSDAQKKAADTRAKASNDQLNAYKALIDAAQQQAMATGREAEGLAALTKSQEMAMALDQGLASGKVKLTAQQEAYYRALIETIGANEETIKANEKAKASAENVRKAVEELDASRRQTIESARTEAESAEQLVATFGMTAQAIEMVTVSRLEDRLARRVDLELDEKEIAYLTELIELKRRSATATGQLDELKKTRDMWESIDKTAHDTFVSIMDGGKSAATRLKDTFKNIFFDWLYQQTIKKWIINLQGSVSTDSAGGALSSIANMFTGASGGGGSSGGGFLGGASNLLSIGKTIYQGFTGGLMTSLGTTITNLGTTFGSAAVAEFGAGMSGVAGTGLAGGAAGAGASAASAIPIIGWIIAGMNAANGFFKQGFDMQNGTVKDPLGLGSGIKTFDKMLRGIGLNDKLANIFSGQAVFAKLFGRANPVVKQQGIEGAIGAGGIYGQNYADIFEKGGVFRSDKSYTKTSAFDAETEKMLDDSIVGIVTAVREMGKSLGLEVGAIEGYNKYIRLALTQDEEANQKLIMDTFAGIGDDLANLLVPNLKAFAAEGESAMATLGRLATEFQSVNAIFEAVGVNATTAFGAVGLASVEARKRLLDLAGGVEGLGQMTTFFAQNFLTAAEQIGPAQKAVTDQLAALGYAGVDSMDEFKTAVLDLAKSGALATESGAKTYAALLALAPAFKTVTDYTSQLAAEQAAAAQAAAEAAQAEKDLAAERAKAAEDAAVQGLRDVAGEMFDALQRSVSTRKDELAAEFDTLMARIGKAIDAQQGKVNKLTSLQQALAGATVGTASADQQQVNRAQAQADIAAALAIARASGVLPNADDLKDALAELNRDTSGQFSSMLEAQRDQVRTQNNIEELAAITGRELTTAERTLATLEAQRTAAQTAYEAEVARLDQMLTTAQQQLDAINGVRTDILTVPAAFQQFADSIMAALKNQTIAGQSSVTSTTKIEALYNSILGRNSDKGGLKYYTDLYNSGTSLEAIAQGLRDSVEYQNNQRSSLYTTQQQSATISRDGSAIVAELQSMNNRMSNVEGAMNRTANNTGATADILDTVTEGGNAMLVGA